MNRLTRALAGLAAVLLIAAGLTAACSSSPIDYPAPTSWSVIYGGQCYTGYLYAPQEADYENVPGFCTRLLYPSYPPVVGMVSYGPYNALWDFELEYSSLLRSGLYYDSYLAPMSTRYHVTIVNKASFVNTSSSFDRQYASQIKTYSAKAHWSNGKAGAYSFPASNAKARNKPLTNTANTGSGWAGTSNSRDRSGPSTNSGTRTAPAGKTGSRR